MVLRSGIHKRCSIRNPAHYAKRPRYPVYLTRGHYIRDDNRTHEITQVRTVHHCERASLALAEKWARAASNDWVRRGRPYFMQHCKELEKWPTDTEKVRPNYIPLYGGANESAKEYREEKSPNDSWPEHIVKQVLCPKECGMCLWQLLCGVEACSCLPEDVRSCDTCKLLDSFYYGGSCKHGNKENACAICVFNPPQCDRYTGTNGLEFERCIWMIKPRSLFAWGVMNGTYTVSDVICRLIDLDLLESVLEASVESAIDRGALAVVEVDELPFH